MSVRAALPILFASAWLVGCGPQSFEASSTSTDERVGAVSLPIMGGEVDDTSTAVMGIYHAGEGSLCTGSLIAPNVLLTARHCVSSFVDQVGAGVLCSTTKVGTPWTTGGFLVTAATELSFANAGEFFVDEVVELDVDSNLACGHDIAILILRDNVPESRATPLLPRLDAALGGGEAYTAIGYGATDGGGSEPGFRRRLEGLTVACVGESCEQEQVIKNTEFEGGAGVCQGDSGGPAIDAEGRVIGVVSRGETNCGTSIYGAVHPFSDWLKDTVVKASGMGLYTAPDWTAGSEVDPTFYMPIGDPCGSGADCPTGICLEGICTRECSAEAPCTLDTQCAPVDGKNLCVEPSLPTGGGEDFNHPRRGDDCTVGPGGVGGTGFGEGWWLAAVAAFALARRRNATRPYSTKR